MLSILLVAALAASQPAATVDRHGIDIPFANEALGAAPVEAEADAAEPAEALICRSSPRIGSRIAHRETCRTAEGWRRYYAEFGMTWGLRSAAGSRPMVFERAVPSGMLIGTH
jgi:hypothetical protein